jgi:hypothetical protein
MRKVNKNIISFNLQTFVSYHILKTYEKNVFECKVMYTWIDMTFLRPRFAIRDNFLIQNSGNKNKTLMYRTQSNGKQYIYKIYTERTWIFGEVARFITKHSINYFPTFDLSCHIFSKLYVILHHEV